MEILTSKVETAYESSIRRFLYQTFPGFPQGVGDLLESVSSSLLGTGQVRYGPKPSPESQVAIRNVIRDAIADSRPVPILIPWGSRKPDLNGTIDVADLSALRMILCLNDAVRREYAPGLDIRLRIEDLTGEFLFEKEGPQFRHHTKQYVRDLYNLIQILGGSNIEPFLESQELRNKNGDFLKFWDNAGKFEEMFNNYFRETSNEDEDTWMTTESFKWLETYGWKGIIPQRQRDYYLKMYQDWHPGEVSGVYRQMMARYFASVLVRKSFDLVGNKPYWNSYAKIYFGFPIPGVPAGIADTTIHYRTIPQYYSRTHLAPWRGRGYIRVHEDGMSTPAIASPKEVPDLTPAVVTFNHQGMSVDVDVSYTERPLK